MLTKRQKQVLSYVEKYIAKHDYAPSLEEIRKHIRVSTISTAHFHIKKLQETGYLYKEDNLPRAISPTKKIQYITIPILGTISAGKPIEAIEVPNETITLAKDEVGKTGDYYALRVQGNSMIEEGIFDGDLVIIREQKVADNGQTIVAIIDDNEATLKKIYREKDRIRLQPANLTLFPIYKKEVEIRGVVVKIIRNLESPREKESHKDNSLKRRIDSSWDYRGENTKLYTHGLHNYPAMFIPQVARRILLTYSQEGDTICDIFCGSGTALVESRLLSRNSYGIDLNPLAIFLAKAKTTEIDPSKLSKEYLKLLNRVHDLKDNEIIKPDFFNIKFWFKDKVIYQLAKIKKAIKEIKEEDIRNFFLVAFSGTVRRSSNTKNGEFKLVRISKDSLSKFDPDVVGIFKNKVELNIKLMTDFCNDADKKTWVKVIYGTSMQDNRIRENSIDCIITSPPYGDSRTTVAYGQFSRLSTQWLDIIDDPNKASGVDNLLLGGRPTSDLKHKLKSKYLDGIINDIAKKDEKRAKETLSFYIDLEKCLRQAYKILKPSKYFCLVIGNRLVKQVRIPTDFIITELGENIGFVCEDIIVRNIPGKRMPSKNSPTNIVGELEETMTKESIVVLRKIE